MADDSKVRILIEADTSGMAQVSVGLKDIVAEQEAFEDASKEAAAVTKELDKALADTEKTVKRATTSTRELGTATEAVGPAVKTATTALTTIGPAAEEAAHLSSGITRELIVMAHEAMQGRFSRIPGSLMVLGERMGGVSLATVGMVGAFAAAAFAVYEVAANAEKSAEALAQLSTQMEANGKSAYVSASAMEDQIESLRRLPGISRETATEIVQDFARAHDIGGDSIIKLTNLVGDFAAATGEKAPAAAKMLAAAFEDPAKGASELQRMFNDTLDPAIVADIHRLEEQGETLKAQAELYDMLSEHINGMLDKSLTPFQGALNGIENSLNNVGRNLSFHIDTPETPGDEDDRLRKKEQVEAFDAQNKALQHGLDIVDRVRTTESERLKITGEITQLKKAEAVASDRGDTQELGLMQASERSLQQRLVALDKKDTGPQQRTGADHSTQDASQEIAEQRQVEQEKYQVAVEYARMTAEERGESGEQEYAQLIEMAQREEAAEQASYQQQLALWQQGSKEYNLVLSQMEKAKAQSELAITKLVQQGTKAEEDEINQLERQREQSADRSARQFETSVKGMQSQFNSNIASMILGTETLEQGFQRMATSLVTGMIEAMLTVAENWAATQLLMIVLGKPTADSIISGHAGEAFAAAYAATAAIPIIGPELAPEAAAAAAAAALAGGTALNSAAGGWDRVPNDQLAMIHKNEMILPASLASSVRSMAGGGAGSISGGDTHVHFNLSAFDGNSVKSMLSQHGPAIAQTVAAQIRNGNRKVGRALSGR